MNSWLKRIKTKAILPVAAFLAATAIGTTFAWQSWDLSVTNELRAHDTSVEINEDGFDPESGTKPVSFVNTGSSSVFLRVSYAEYWEKTEDDKRYTLSNTVNGKEIAQKVWTEAWKDQWQNGGDGWYYYKKVLKSGIETDKVLSSVSFDMTMMTEDYEYLKQQYLNAEYKLYFKVEAVQCSDGSNTLNSDEVNAEATKQLFGRTALVQKDPQTGEITGVSWQ